MIYAEDDELVPLLQAYNSSITDKPLLLMKDTFTREGKILDRICYYYDDWRVLRDVLLQYMFVCDEDRLYKDNKTARVQIR